MKRITLITFLCTIVSVITAQNFHYKSNLAYGVSINDAVELNGKFYFVGNIDSSGTHKPYFCVLNNRGAMIFDTIFNSSGMFINIHKVNNVLHISHYSEPFSGYHTNFNLQFDTNFVFQSGVNISDGILQKSKLINDSLILYIGYEPPPFPNHAYTSFVAKQNVNTGNVTYNFPASSVNPIETHDIISPSVGKYHIFLNSADSSIADQVSVLYLNDSLQVFKTLQLNSSYRLFGTDSTIKGTVSAEYKSGVINMNCIVDHPTYLNQLNSSDLAFVQFDTNYNELSISFSGKTDTNYTTSRNSIAIDDNSIFTGGTGENEIILNQYDSSNNRLRFTVYHDASNLELKKIVAFKDSILIVGNTNDQFFAIKLDSIPSQIITSLKEKDNFQSVHFKVFPNPAENYINIKSDNIQIKKLELYNQNGTLIKEIYKLPSSTINIENLKAGVYFIRLITEYDQIHSILFIKT